MNLAQVDPGGIDRRRCIGQLQATIDVRCIQRTGELQIGAQATGDIGERINEQGHEVQVAQIDAQLAVQRAVHQHAFALETGVQLQAGRRIVLQRQAELRASRPVLIANRQTTWRKRNVQRIVGTPGADEFDGRGLEVCVELLPPGVALIRGLALHRTAQACGRG